MMRIIKAVLGFSILLLLVITSCKKDIVVIDENLPGCIEEILTDSIDLATLNTIQAVVIDNEIHYWLNTEARHIDGLEFIVNEKCDTVCSFGGFSSTECAAESTDGWQIVWRP